MQLRFNVGWHKGQLGWRRIPVYAMPCWRVTHSDDQHVLYRPSARTLQYVLVGSLFAVLLLAIIVWYAGWPWSSRQPVHEAPRGVPGPEAEAQAVELNRLAEQMKQRLPPEKIEELQRNAARRRAAYEAEAEQLQRGLSVFAAVGQAFHWLSVVALIAYAAIPLIAQPLQSVRIERAADGALTVRKRGLWPSTRSWPPRAFDQVTYSFQSANRRVRRRYVPYEWQWLVKLQATPQVSLDNPLNALAGDEVAFVIDRQTVRPAGGAPPPESVRELVEHLARLTGAVFNESASRRNRRSLPTSTLRTTVGEGPIEEFLSAAPDELRDSIAQALSDRTERTVELHRSIRVTVRDADGSERVYTSLDEMPAHVRENYERALRSSRENRGS